MKRGDIWWARMPPPDKTRPVLLISRDEAYRLREFVTVAKVTTRRRGIFSEVALGTSEGLRKAGVANCDDVQTIAKSVLVARAGELAAGKVDELDRALKFALGLD